MVEVYYKHQRIALHQRNPSKGIYITNKDHLSSQHKAYTDWSPDYFKRKAAAHGNNVLECIEGVLGMGDYPETQYKRSMGIIQLHRQYGSERLDNACKIAVEAEIYSYKRIENILKNNLDKEPIDLHLTGLFESHIPAHKNIRGAKSYK